MAAELNGVLVEAGPDGQPALFREPVEVVTAHDAASARAALDRLEVARRQGCWIAGFAAYELGYALEPRLAPLLEGVTGPLLTFGIFDAPADPAPLLEAAEVASAEVRVTEARPLWDRAAYARRFDEIKRMIARGDLYQVNLTMPVEVGFDGSPLGLWGAMRGFQPVRHGAYLEMGGVQLLSRSPELFCRLAADGRIEVAPMKGTAPRGATTRADTELREALAGDVKNRAENIMIVDLMRNDLSRIARVGSVRVPRLLEVETYETVHQMVSRVEAQLEAPAALPALMEALFPCGSITGAPKIAAMQAIHRLEGWERGAYCGAIGWAAPDGRADFNVAIRTLTISGHGRARMGVGGGIVHDSACESEYEEALWKARFVTGLIPRSA
ncbi:MAG: aminodeoxychorismate synthase, component I [Rhodobacteraceae bacterium]|jgi:para-aminobenzoate synthetase component 1|uniref:Aminodeoxychorismate synthase, subunit I n=1 Tax=Salipiger profundus TaxID=1229727 RepID=A0A1U7CZQ6_9RHOB|nr:MULTISPECIES: aminodeoxychorismate synthase component I [Salipiger]APX21371.1 aminodeoxychorismate synthase, subunit I [Salipiger profundus]MAB08781.1 aminodeoxychorismate synthase, component I [Paracoccaceae bacterium]GGA02863.1 aminodeoxychorismate synthase, component I [Salipiger profundus]SFC23658.1 aminodeoxychorismate synthase, subunit I [Salipiger profundus]